MKTLLICLLLAATQPADSLRVLFWNVENFFDWRNDSTSVSDAEFSSQGTRRWTRKRFKTKCDAIAKAILWAGVPDVIGLAEVENARVLKQLLQETALRKLDYRIVHFDSPDTRGIDVALLYRASRAEFVSAKPCHLYASDSSVLATRDILLAQLRTSAGSEIAFLVNHHPSKFGGAAASAGRRRLALMRLKQLADSLQADGTTRILVMGDMNDTPENPAFQLLAPSLENRAENLHRQGKGTIKYEGQWELIDMFFASPSARTGPMRILQIPFLMTRDGAHTGTKPLRTYSGPRYVGGVSDHCPIQISIRM